MNDKIITITIIILLEYRRKSSNLKEVVFKNKMNARILNQEPSNLRQKNVNVV